MTASGVEFKYKDGIHLVLTKMDGSHHLCRVGLESSSDPFINSQVDVLRVAISSTL